jgi:hypothetical protein
MKTEDVRALMCLRYGRAEEKVMEVLSEPADGRNGEGIKKTQIDGV